MTWLGIGQARSIEATRPCGYDCAVPRQRLQEPERVLCQLLREKKLDIVEKNDVGFFCSDHVVEDTRDAGCPLAMRQFEKTFREAKINIEPWPTVLGRQLGQHGGFSGAGRPNRQHELIVGIPGSGQHVLDLRGEGRGHSASSLVARRCLLLLDPTVEIVSLEPPLAADLECRKLRLLGHRVDGLFRNLQQDGDLGQR